MRRPNEEEERRLILLFAEARIPTEESTSYLRASVVPSIESHKKS
jgi:hypothetical protein